MIDDLRFSTQCLGLIGISSVSRLDLGVDDPDGVEGGVDEMAYYSWCVLISSSSTTVAEGV